MTTIPLNHLTPGKTNVRKTGARDGIDELAASIAAHGLLTSLAVRKSSRGKYAVVAGQRRYHALALLARQGHIASDHPVLCHLLDREADGTEIGLAENVVRVAMHPADQFDAFRSLADKGLDAAAIATRFGVSEATVTRRLKLGRVAPAILEAYRAGSIGLDHVQAFALSDDHAAQERIFAVCKGRSVDPGAIRHALTHGEVPSSDPRLRFVGLDAYEAAGGAVRRDLFDGEHEGYAQDVALLDQLVMNRLASCAEAVRAEGWSWVETRLQFGYADGHAFRRIAEAHVGLSEEAAATLERLTAERDALLEEYDEQYGEDSSADSRLEALEAGIAELEATSYAWTPEQLARAGAIVSLSQDGAPAAHRGLVRLPDEEAPAEPIGEAQEVEGPSPAPLLSATLVEALTACRTAALRASLAQCPDIALAAVTHALAHDAFYRTGGASCLALALTERRLSSAAGTQGATTFDAVRSEWAAKLPEEPKDLWSWCLRQPQDTLLALLAVSAAHAVDAVRLKGTREDAPALLHADALAKASGFDMHDWFSPTAANYFGQVNRSLIAEALVEAGRPARIRIWSKMRKADLAALAEREIQGTGWLPLPLRPVAEAMPSDAEEDGTRIAEAA